MKLLEAIKTAATFVALILIIGAILFLGFLGAATIGA